MPDKPYILGICGWSGCGKTVLVEAVVLRLRNMGLKTAVVKHDVHGLNIDHPGKDSDRFFQAGADVFLQGPEEEVLRLHGTVGHGWGKILDALPQTYDVVLVEGHKSMPIPKIWLLSPEETEPPSDLSKIVAILPTDSDRVGVVMSILEEWLSNH